MASLDIMKDICFLNRRYFKEVEKALARGVGGVRPGGVKRGSPDEGG